MLEPSHKFWLKHWVKAKVTLRSYGHDIIIAFFLGKSLIKFIL